MIAAALAGCGASGVPTDDGNQLAVYTDLPLGGPQSYVMTSIEDGEQLALAVAERRHLVKDFLILPLVPVQDGTRAGWDPAVTTAAASSATQNVTAIAYIGDFDSAATATSLPITNSSHLLQVSPASPYAGLTDPSVYDTKGEPASYYPSGTQTFARLVPTDVQEAKATVSFMRSLGVSRLYTLSDSAPYASYDSGIAAMVAADAKQAGITVAGSAQFDSSAAASSTDYASIAKVIAASKADAVLVGALPDAGVEALWQELYGALPGAKLFAPSTLATNLFIDSLGPAANVTYVTSPILPLSQYGPQAQGVLREYKRRYGRPTQWSLYGYEAMMSVIEAIQRAGRHANNRLDVVRAYFHLGWRYSVIGLYRINASGDTSRSRFAGYEGSYPVFPATGLPTLREIRSHLDGG